MNRHLATALLGLTSLLSSGCLGSLGGEAPPPIRYFSALPPGPEAPSVVVDAPILRLRRVSAAQHLSERMVWRVSDVEYGFQELSRWTEKPAAYLNRSLVQELFQRRGFTRSESLDVPSLEVDLVAFEELLGVEPAARVAIDVSLAESGGKGLLVRSFQSEMPLEGSGPAAFAVAARAGLEQVTRDLAEALEASL